MNRGVALGIVARDPSDEREDRLVRAVPTEHPYANPN